MLRFLFIWLTLQLSRRISRCLCWWRLLWLEMWQLLRHEASWSSHLSHIGLHQSRWGLGTCWFDLNDKPNEEVSCAPCRSLELVWDSLSRSLSILEHHSLWEHRRILDSLARQMASTSGWRCHLVWASQNPWTGSLFLDLHQVLYPWLKGLPCAVAGPHPTSHVVSCSCPTVQPIYSDSCYSRTKQSPLLWARPKTSPNSPVCPDVGFLLWIWISTAYQQHPREERRPLGRLGAPLSYLFW